MKLFKKAICSLCLVSILTLSVKHALGQEQFEKRFDIAFDHTPFYEALMRLVQTQTIRTVLRGAPEIFKDCPEITLILHQVTLDEALDKLISMQTIYKDYLLTSSESHDVLELKKAKVDARYFNKDKNRSRFYHVGDQLPDSLYTLENYPNKIRLSDYRGKLLILDLWGVHCSGCIEAMPNLEKIQSEFPDQIKILLVTKSSKEEIKLLKQNSSTVRNIKLPIISGENDLASSFMGIDLPKQVWIDGSGKIRYITSNEICKAAVIEDFLAGRYLNIHETRDTVLSSDAPMAYILNPINHGDFKITCYLAKHVESKYNYYSGGSLPSDSDTAKWSNFQRVSVFDLYKIAYGTSDIETFSDTRLIIAYKNPDKYDVNPLTGDNMFDFELGIKNNKATLNQFVRLMRQQLDIGFNLSSSWQKRQVPCFVVKKIGNTDKLKSRKKLNDIDLRDNIMTVSNESIATIIWFMQRKNLSIGTLIDETGIDQNLKIDCVANINLKDRLEDVNRTLLPYGLAIVKETRSLDCIVLEEPKL